MHLDQERIRRFLDGELLEPQALEAREHLAACADCRSRVEDARREDLEVDFLLRGLDHATPPVRVEDVVQAAAMRRGPSEAPLARIVAGFVIAVVLAGAAYAIPGSPLPRWADAVFEWIAARSAPPVSDPAAPDTGVAGIAVVPGEALLIEFTAHQSAGLVRLSLSDADPLTVRASIGAATFRSDVDRLVIDNRGSSASFEIRIPRGAPRVEVRSNDRTVFLKEGPRIRAEGPVDASGFYVVPLTSAGR